ncbi:tryptophan halogenase family protein [Colwellia sp. UCD-KL20]|uniref:tryptophan halogenase family protein n=1 Tax=Colwellia sp. UCD-KL20 TaxID=1917165 RepID=UPI0009705309|nr:tryptophan halogenase family protein [Colwellia sp. UCD-KL20]
MSQAIKHIVIVGGGTAGWLTAGIIASEHFSYLEEGVQITLIESPDIKAIGVGEGTWPTMRHTLEMIGISENDFINSCDASFKQGSKFSGWVNGKLNDNYYHPFVAPIGHGTCNLSKFWQQNQSTISFAHLTSFQPHLCDYGLAPKQPQTPEYAAVANYGYHLNAGKFSELLKQHCIKKLGVKHITAHVDRITENTHGHIDHITTNNNLTIKGDLFIDCSGSSAILISKHYNIPFISKKHILFNDSALAAQVSYPDNNSPINSHTLSTATESGWIWDIGLYNRKGIGHVYSSKHTNDIEAEKILRNYIAKDLPLEQVNKISFKKLTFEPGYREVFWHKNCVAVGMAAGFLEPLEASALALVELSAKMISKELPSTKALFPITAKRFNKRFHYRWEKIIEFLKLHYVLSQRSSSQYWLDNKDPKSIPEHLTDLLSVWKYQPPSHNDLFDIEEIFPSASYQYILYGMGFTTEETKTIKKFDDQNLAFSHFDQAQQLTTKYIAGLPTNRHLINIIKGINNKQ